MKKYLLMILAGIVFAGCENHKAELAQASKQNDSLMAVINSKDATVNDFLNSFNEIQDNLSTITQKENMVASNAASGTDINKPTKDKIKDDIAAINTLMDNNKKAIAALQKKLKGAYGKSAHLEKMVASLNEQMEQKDKELADLNAKVESLNSTVATLNANVTDLSGQNTTRQQTIESQTKAMHTAYYTVGTSKQLKDEKVVDKEGGILGIGSEAMLDPNFNTNAFKTIDITQTSTIPLNAKEAKLVSTHPKDSYKFQVENKKVTNLVIIDPDKFWSASKYLVVLTD